MEIGYHEGLVANELITADTNYCEKGKTFKYLGSFRLTVLGVSASDY